MPDQRPGIMIPSVQRSDEMKFELAQEVLRSSGKLRLQVTGWSMLPAIWPGDILMIERADFEDVSVGAVVLFRRNGRFCVHRVTRKDVAMSVLETCGDSMPESDPMIRSRDLLGEVAKRLHNGRWITMRRTPRWHEYMLAALLRRSTFVTRVVVGIHGIFRARTQQATGAAIPCHN